MNEIRNIRLLIEINSSMSLVNLNQHVMHNDLILSHETIFLLRVIL